MKQLLALSFALPLLAAACGGGDGSPGDRLVNELQRAVDLLESCETAEAAREAVPELEEASQRVLDLSTEMSDLPEEEKQKIRERYGDKISDLSKRYVKQTARFALKRQFMGMLKGVFRKMGAAIKRIATLRRG